MSLREDVSRIAAVAAAHAAPAQQLAAVLPVETAAGERVYLSAFADADGRRQWLALTNDGAPITSRARVREAASIAALVEIAEEAHELDADEPRVASLPYLDGLGADGGIASAIPVVDELMREVEANYKLDLS